jgi:hypothetical protein
VIVVAAAAHREAAFDAAVRDRGDQAPGADMEAGTLCGWHDGMGRSDGARGCILPVE